jgi:hypothetical protein
LPSQQKNLPFIPFGKGGKRGICCTRFAQQKVRERLMIFLIEYNRPEGRLITFKTFADEERSKADELRFAIELDLHRRKIEHEVVLLQAESEAALRRTHGRYFYVLGQILELMRGAIE